MSCLTGPRCYINTNIQHEVKQYKPIHKLTYCQLWLYICYILKWLPIHKLKNEKYKLYNCADDFKYCTCAKRETFKQLAGEQCRVICGAWASKHTYITVVYCNQSFCGIMDTQWCVKVSNACRGECVATGGLCRPAHLNFTEIKV